MAYSFLEDMKKRWVGHFKELLNQPTDVNLSILDELEKRPFTEEFGRHITMEVKFPVKNAKLKKNPGSDDIIPEVLAYSCQALLASILAYHL